MNNRVNYDKIAKDYNQRFLKNPHQGALKALRRILSKGNLRKVLEVGCGTGHWLKALNSIEDGLLFGVDASFQMLRRAEEHSEVGLCQGLAEHLPIKSRSIDFLFVVNALHHFEDKINFFDEGYRVLSKGGRLAVIGMDPRDDRNRWYIYKYFDGTYERDLSRFPSWSQVNNWFSQFGYEDIEIHDVEIIHDPKHGKSVLIDPFLEKSACSQLTLLSNAAYEKGLHKLKNSLKKNAISPIIYENDIVLSMMVGKKPA